MIDTSTVQKTAQLAQLELSSEKIVSLGAQFANILKDFSILQKVDTQGVAPMVTPLENLDIWRQDEIQRPSEFEEIMANAPESQGTLYKVPPVV